MKKRNWFIRLLVWIGIVRIREDDTIRWPVHIAPKHCWSWGHTRAMWIMHQRLYTFSNLPGVIKWVPGRLLPRRWGFGILGLIEFGDRG